MPPSSDEDVGGGSELEVVGDELEIGSHDQVSELQVSVASLQQVSTHSIIPAPQLEYEDELEIGLQIQLAESHVSVVSLQQTSPHSVMPAPQLEELELEEHRH